VHRAIKRTLPFRMFVASSLPLPEESGSGISIFARIAFCLRLAFSSKKLPCFASQSHPPSLSWDPGVLFPPYTFRYQNHWNFPPPPCEVRKTPPFEISLPVQRFALSRKNIVFFLSFPQKSNLHLSPWSPGLFLPRFVTEVGILGLLLSFFLAKR